MNAKNQKDDVCIHHTGLETSINDMKKLIYLLITVLTLTLGGLFVQQRFSYSAIVSVDKKVAVMEGIQNSMQETMNKLID